MNAGRAVMLTHSARRAWSKRTRSALETFVSMTIGARERTVLRLHGRQKGGALLLGEILDHHLIVPKKGTSAARQLLDRQLEVLFTVVRRVRRHVKYRSRRAQIVIARRLYTGVRASLSETNVVHDLSSRPAPDQPGFSDLVSASIRVLIAPRGHLEL